MSSQPSLFEVDHGGPVGPADVGDLQLRADLLELQATQVVGAAGCRW